MTYILNRRALRRRLIGDMLFVLYSMLLGLINQYCLRGGGGALYGARMGGRQFKQSSD